MSVRSSSFVDDLDDRESWLGSIGDESIPTLSLDDVLKDCSWEEGGSAAGLLEGVSFRDDEFSLLDGSGRPMSVLSSATSTTTGYTLDCPVRSRMMDKVSLLLMAHGQNEGSPTAMAIRDTRLAVCTTRGTLLIFSLTTENLERAVRCELQPESAACCAFSPDGRTVAVGHAKGRVRIISTSTGAIEFASSSVVQMDRGILQIAFLSTRSLLVLDSGGSVYEVRQKRGMLGTRREESRCVFSGCNGEVVHFFLPPKETKLQLLFLVSLTKVLLVSTARGGAVLCAFPAGGPADAPPVIDFRQCSPDLFFLLVGRGQRLSLYRVIPSRLGGQKRAASLHRTVEMGTKHPLVAARFHHAGTSLVTVIDAQERVHSIDLDKGTVVEGDQEECSIQCVFASADYKGLAYGGNVSAAMRAVAENVAYGSCIRAGSSILVLGPSVIYELSVMDEQQQLDTFYDRRDYIAAALFLLDLVKGRVVARDPVFISHIHMRTTECLRLLLDDTLVGVNSGRVAELIAHYRRNIDVLLRVAVGARLFDVLYEEIYPMLEKDSLSKAVLLEYLDDYVLDGALEQPPPFIVSDYLSNLINEGHFSQLQSAVVRIPIECIDLHKVMTTCRQNGLYDGVIYVMNRALGDFLGPLEEMLDTVASFSGRGDLLSDHEVQQGAQLLLYLHCCLAGAAYPIGSLPEDQEKTVPVQVYRCITSVHGKESVGRREEGAYPYLRLLLQFDAQQFLHVVCTCADAPLFQSEDNRLQRLTEIVGMLSLECKSASILSEYLKFVANLVATDRIQTPTETVNQGIEALLRLPILSQGEEQSVVEVMRYVTGIDMERVLRLSSKPLRVTICSHIYRLQRRFVDLLKCYLTPPVNTDSFFDVANRLLVSELKREERKEIEQFLKGKIEELCALSPTSTASLVVEQLGEYWGDLRRRTSPDQRRGVRLQCGEMIAEAFRLRRERGDHFLTGDEVVDEWLFEMAFEWACGEGRKEDEEMKSLLLYWLPLGSKTDLCLNAAAESGRRVGSVVLLLEARGLLGRAFALLLERLDAAIEGGEEGELISSTDSLLSLARSHPEEAGEEGWMLTLFHRIVRAERRGEGGGAMHSRLLHTVERVLESGSERAVDIIESLMEDGEFRGGRYSDHSPLLDSMLDACEYERRVLDAYVRMQAAEGAEAFRQITALSSRRVDTIIAPECASCGGPITKASYLYSCGHVQHQECWTTREKACPICSDQSSIDQGSESSITVPSSAPPPHHRGALNYARDDKRPKRRKNIFDMWNDEMYLGPAGEL